MTQSFFKPDEIQFVRDAERFLENPGFLIRAMNALGKKLETGKLLLPKKAAELITGATNRSLHAALDLSLKTLNPNIAKSDHGKLHVAAAAITGGMGGFFGLAALPIELPVTTCLMLRSIAQIAVHHGVDLRLPENRLECLAVFSLGSRDSDADDCADTGYYSARFALAASVQEAARFLAELPAKHSLNLIEKGAAPQLLALIARIAARFEITVTEKALAEALPFIGAAGGALVNSAFTDYYNDAARFHFGLKKLEREYGQRVIQDLYAHCYRDRLALEAIQADRVPKA